MSSLDLSGATTGAVSGSKDPQRPRTLFDLTIYGSILHRRSPTHLEVVVVVVQRWPISMPEFPKTGQGRREALDGLFRLNTGFPQPTFLSLLCEGMARKGKLASFVSSLLTDPIGMEEHQFHIARIWSQRIRTFACWYQKPMPYHLAMSVVTWEKEKGLEERAVQGRRDIASQPGYP